MTIRRTRTSVGVAVLVAAVAVGAFLAAGASARESALPRAQTLYTSGTAWGPFTQFNPLRSSGNATGTTGRVTRGSGGGADPSLPAGAVHDLHGFGLVIADLGEVDRIRLELAESGDDGAEV